MRWKLHDEVQAGEELLGHVIFLGGADSTADDEKHADVEDFLRRLEIPVRAEYDPREGDEFGLWFEDDDEDGNPTKDPARRAKTSEYYPELRDVDPNRPEFVAGMPELVHDLALIARRPNPFNQSASVTILQGLFSHGTHGAVLAFTRERGPRNERALQESVDPRNFWLIARVPTLAGRRTIPPELGQVRNVVRHG